MSAQEVRADGRPDWRESLTLASDLALLGIVVTIACLPVLTAGAALATGSVIADRVCRRQPVPSIVDIWRLFRRALLPGLGATLVFAAGLALLGLDAGLIRSGRVPGGPVALAATAVLAAVALVAAAVTVVGVGTTGGRGWRDAARATAARLPGRPLGGVATLLVVAVPVLLASAIPVTAPLLVGLGLFALHVVARRTGLLAS